jgi:NADH-quinone oxidoreductase subunit N
MNALLAAVQAPSIEYGALAPLIVLAGGSIAVIFVSLIGGDLFQRILTPLTAVATLIAAGVLFALRIGEPDLSVLSGALRIDDLAMMMDLIFVASALSAAVLAWRSTTVREAGTGEFYGLLIAAVLGMAVLASAQNLVTFFIGFELFSIPLYVLCAADLRRNGSLESGLKYLIIGSLGSATLVYGLAFIYGATGSTDFGEIGDAIATASVGQDAMLLVGVGLALVGLAFKASVAPFHQWTPDVYQGAPTPVTAFMAVATKAVAFAILLRFCGQAIEPIRDNWAIVLAILATVTIAVGNLGALGQDSLKRMLAYSGVAQAGYLLTGVVVGTQLGVEATVFYLFIYLLMNVGPFAVIVARERAGAGETMRSLHGLGREAPALAWPLTICMIALAGLPITAGFLGKLFLVQAAIDGGYSWLAVVIVLGSAVSLGYYLRVIAAVWITPGTMRLNEPAPGEVALAGAAPEADARSHPELVAVAVIAAVATVAFGVAPEPLLDLARDAGQAFTALSR